MPRHPNNLQHLNHNLYTNMNTAANIDIDAFRERQRRDYQRLTAIHDDAEGGGMRQRGKSNRLSEMGSVGSGEGDNGIGKGRRDVTKGWRNGEGERLGDFRVDEESEEEFSNEEEEEEDEDDIPLSEVLKTRKVGKTH
ncbi:MAG: hypothetical protein Q9169_008122 [Polycauliona sp. 2 TL-2023]